MKEDEQKKKVFRYLGTGKKSSFADILLHFMVKYMTSPIGEHLSK
jgi:hypothetical protein